MSTCPASSLSLIWPTASWAWANCTSVGPQDKSFGSGGFEELCDCELFGDWEAPGECDGVDSSSGSADCLGASAGREASELKGPIFSKYSTTTAPMISRAASAMSVLAWRITPLFA